MNKIVECVPNFSEGRDKNIIDAIAGAIEKTEGCTLLDVDPGKSTNRTVYTFVGSPQTVVEGAMNAAKKAFELMDMSKHKGEHHRMGAMDVCPFIPVSNVSMEECVEISKTFAQRLALELDIPVFLYEESAKDEYRKKLPQVREGEYEGLEKKFKDPKWKPDYGPARFISSWGATAVGARSFLIAYNVNLLSTPNQAHRIALNLREAGRGPDEPGRLKEVKGMGWFVDEYNLAQVTVNLTDYRITPIHLLFEEVKKEASTLSLATAGSEIVGLVPLDAMLMAADYYIEKEDLFILEEDQKIRLAVERLGLNSVSPFNPRKKIIEYMVEEDKNQPLANMSLKEFIRETASRSSAPGGGSAAAVMASIGAGLGSMAAKLTLGVRKFETLDRRMRSIIPALHRASADLIPLIDADTNAFNDYMEALRMPRGTEEEKNLRVEKMQLGLKKAVEIPLETMRTGSMAWESMVEVAKHGNFASRSDIEVGARALETGIWGAHRNVLINLKDIRDEEFNKITRGEADLMADHAVKECARVLEILEAR